MSRLDEIKARCAAKLKGPWVRDMHSPDMSSRSGWYIRGHGNSAFAAGAQLSDAARRRRVHRSLSRRRAWLVDQVEEASGAGRSRRSRKP